VPLDVERGSVTAELAIGLPVVVLLVVLLAALAGAGVTELRCDAAARAGAREAALGSPDASVRATAQRVAGDGTTVDVAASDGWTTVRVSAPVAFGPWVAPLRVSGSAVAKDEP
jgi:hypothetical protein